MMESLLEGLARKLADDMLARWDSNAHIDDVSFARVLRESGLLEVLAAAEAMYSAEHNDAGEDCSACEANRTYRAALAAFRTKVGGA